MVLRDGLVRADIAPLVFKALGCDALPRGARVRVRITGIDLLTLELHASLATRLDDPAVAVGTDTAEEAEDDSAAAAPLALAIDIMGDDASDGDAAPAALAAA